jgi:hypothetical protein
MLAFFLNSDDERYGAFVCDRCKRPIKNLSLAMVVVKDLLTEDEEEATMRSEGGLELILIHKISCDRLMTATTLAERTADSSWGEAIHTLADALDFAGVEVSELDYKQS